MVAWDYGVRDKDENSAVGVEGACWEVRGPRNVDRPLDEGMVATVDADDGVVSWLKDCTNADPVDHEKWGPAVSEHEATLFVDAAYREGSSQLEVHGKR